MGLRQRGRCQQKQEVPAAIGGSGATLAGVASAEAGGAGSDWGEWGAVVGTSGGDDSSSKDDASKGGGAVVEPRSKIPQQPGKPAEKTKIPLGNLQ